MTHVGLAIHGVSNRDSAGFTSTVEKLRSLGGAGMPELRPVFWGMLGPEGPLGSIPGDADAAELPAPAGAFGIGPPESLTASATETAAATVARLGPAVDAEMAAEVEAALQQAATEGLSLALSADLAPLLADAVAAGPSPDDAAGAFGPVDWVKNRVLDVVRHVNDAIVDLLVREFRHHEAGLGGTIAHTLGDVLVYQSEGPRIRGVLDAAYQAARAEGHEVDVVAHSLGALATVEWLLGAETVSGHGPVSHPEDRVVRHLVTFGTQVSLFSELMGLRRAGPDEFGPGPGPQGLPIQVASWTNVWQELDPLAFVMGHVLHRDGANPLPGVDDFRLTQKSIPTNLSFHSSYWGDPRFALWLAEKLGG